ncbi:MAG: exodeoxyribonuclease III [Rhodospirillales bacterium]|nr:exodeoxyribonuclease III [Rhodospirillales bacterium]
MKIVTWNVNSVRLRIDHLTKLVDQYQPDVICLQETKVDDPLFPHLEISGLGYPYRAVHGQKSYNGLAILSKIPFEGEERTHSWCGKDDRRHQSVDLSCGLELHNLYIPAGGDLPDAKQNPKFAHKLNFLTEQTAWWLQRQDPKAKRMIVGDFNIAPRENDVWSHKALKNTITHTQVEIDHLTDFQSSGPWHDALIAKLPEDEKPYTWWSYRNRNWPGPDPSKDRGRRLDHIWASPNLDQMVEKITIVREIRGWERPSDHSPVMVTLDI